MLLLLDAQIRASIFYPNIRKELIYHGSIPGGEEPELHGHVKPPPTQPRLVPKVKGTSLSNALPAGRMGLYPKGAFSYQPGGHRRNPGSGAGTGTGRLCDPYQSTQRERTARGG